MISYLPHRRSSHAAPVALAVDSFADTSTTSSTTINFDNVQGGMSDGVVVVAVSNYPTARSVSSCSYDGISLVFLGRSVKGSVAAGELWGAAVGNLSSGTKTVSVTMDASTSEVSIGVIALSGGNQTSPFGTVSTSADVGSTVALSPVSAEGDIIVDCLASYVASTKTADSGQTEFFREDISGSGTDGHGSYKPASTGATTTVGWDLSSGQNSAYLAVAIKAS